MKERIREDSRMIWGQPRGCLSLLVILLIAAICLCSCKTKEQVVQYVYKTDTLRETRIDTCYHTKVVETTRDSIVRDSVFVQVDADGKVVYKEVLKYVYVGKQSNDSTLIYKALIDSLQKASKNDSIKTETKVVTKTDYGGWFAFAGLLLLILGAVVIVYAIRKK